MILILVLLLGLGWNATSLAQTPFFQGKTITIAVGTKAGGLLLRYTVSTFLLYPRLC